METLEYIVIVPKFIFRCVYYLFVAATNFILDILIAIAPIIFWVVKWTVAGAAILLGLFLTWKYALHLPTKI